MTTKEIRQSVIDGINGKQMAGPDDDPFDLPPTCEESIANIIRTARGYLEEWGLPPRFKLGMECHVGPNGERMEWVFEYYYSDRNRFETIRVSNLRPRDGLAEIYREMQRRLATKGGAA